MNESTTVNQHRTIVVIGEVERLTGRPARTYAQWARDHAGDVR